MTEGGLKQVDSSPDLFVTYHITTQENTVYNTSTFGYGGDGRGWGGGMANSTTTEMNYTEGTIIIDGYEPGEKNMVWRGTGTVTVKSKPEKQAKQIDKILAKLGAKWDNIHAGQAK